jgi:hypothetical protein
MYQSGNTGVFAPTLASQTHSGSWTWTPYTYHLVDLTNGFGLAVFIAVAPASSSGTITFGTTAGTVSEWNHIIAKTTGAEAIPVQVTTNNGTTTTLAVTLATPQTDSCIFGAIHGVNGGGTTFGSGYTELSDLSPANLHFLEVQYDLTATTTCNWSTLTDTYPTRGIAIELAPEGSGPPSGDMPIVLASAHSAATQASVTTTPFSVEAGDVLVACVGFYNSTSNLQNWVAVGSQTHSGSWAWLDASNWAAGTADGCTIAILYAKAPAAGTGTITFNRGGAAGTISDWAYAIHKVLGRSGTINQSGPVDHTAGTTASVALGMGPAGDHTIGAIYGFGNGAVPGAGYTETAEVGNGTFFLQTQYYPNPITVCDWTGLTAGFLSAGLAVGLQPFVFDPPPWIELALPTTAASIAGVATVTTTGFTPTAGAMLIAVTSVRRSSTTAATLPTISNTGTTLTWTQIADVSFGGTNPSMRQTAWWALVPATVASTAVTSASTSATNMYLSVHQIAFGADTDFSNFATATNTVGDPAPVLPTAPAAESIVLSILNGAGTVAPTMPTGFTALHGAASTTLYHQVAGDDTTPGTASAWVSTNTRSTAITFEVKSTRLKSRGGDLLAIPALGGEGDSATVSAVASFLFPPRSPAMQSFLVR